jgi:hypothetical protein
MALILRVAQAYPSLSQEASYWVCQDGGDMVSLLTKLTVGDIPK